MIYKARGVPIVIIVEENYISMSGKELGRSGIMVLYQAGILVKRGL
jgi:hypothetical protein